jgi:hypothetical protein
MKRYWIAAWRFSPAGKRCLPPAPRPWPAICPRRHRCPDRRSRLRSTSPPQRQATIGVGSMPASISAAASAAAERANRARVAVSARAAFWPAPTSALISRAVAFCLASRATSTGSFSTALPIPTFARDSRKAAPKTAVGLACQTQSGWLGTARVRVGYAFDQLLVYVTGGGAFGNVQTSLNCLGEQNTMEFGWTVASRPRMRHQ